MQRFSREPAAESHVFSREGKQYLLYDRVQEPKFSLVRASSATPRPALIPSSPRMACIFIAA